MDVGKLKASELRSLIFKYIENNNPRILTEPSIGKDCAAVDCGDEVLYLSSDPITGSTKEVGKLFVNVNCNDIATTGARPLGIMVTLLAPPSTNEGDISDILSDIQVECEKLGVTVLGGHTEITSAVNQVVLSGTVIGLGSKGDYNKRDVVKDGDLIVLSKGVGIEGTGIIAFEKEEELTPIIGRKLVEEGKALLDHISVLDEGTLGSPFVKSMHDVTEGGILGALWEMAEGHSVGIDVDTSWFNIHPATKAICSHYNIDPLKLISSGSMIMILESSKLAKLDDAFKDKDIDIRVIGKITSNKDKILRTSYGTLDIEEPSSDELYKVV